MKHLGRTYRVILRSDQHNLSYTVKFTVAVGNDVSTVFFKNKAWQMNDSGYDNELAFPSKEKVSI